MQNKYGPRFFVPARFLPLGQIGMLLSCLLLHIGQIPPMVFGVMHGFESFIPARSTGSGITLTIGTCGHAIT